ncbi:class I SAM-dependent methyltransferase [Bacillaceae bacterium IKA-2]|nr:class I SAM-dependent methyltransferase [Bacillaceae bacterium IKA-2]
MDPKSKWNGKHNDRLNSIEQPTPNARLKGQLQHLTGGSALDFACGLGANSLFLAEIGYEVQALDISDVAIQHIKEEAKKQKLPVHACVGDLTDWSNLNLQKSSFDLVVITYYLDRLTFPFVKSIIKEDGYLFMETFYLSPRNETKGVSDQYKLRSSELLSVFGDWQVLYYEENVQEGRQTVFVRNRSTKLTKL